MCEYIIYLYQKTLRIHQTKLELTSSKSTYPTHTLHELHYCTTWNMMSTTFSYLGLRGQLCAWAESTCILHGGHGSWAWLQWSTKGHYLWHSWTMPNDSKHIQACLSLISTDWLHLRAAQVPRCRDLAIFMVTTTDRQTDYFTPAHVCGVITVMCLIA